MTNYIVSINYLDRIRENDRGITTDYRSKNLQTYYSKDEAIAFCRRYRHKLEPRETLYVTEKNSSTELSVYYLSSRSEGHIN